MRSISGALALREIDVLEDRVQALAGLRAARKGEDVAPADRDLGLAGLSRAS